MGCTSGKVWRCKYETNLERLAGDESGRGTSLWEELMKVLMLRNLDVGVQIISLLDVFDCLCTQC